jgi:hypothetical protein
VYYTGSKTVILEAVITVAGDVGAAEAGGIRKIKKF